MIRNEFTKRIELEVLSILGFRYVTGKLFDEETSDYVLYNGGYILDPDNSCIVHSNDTIFDLIGNYKLTEALFKIFLRKENEDNGLYVFSSSIIDEEKYNVDRYLRRSVRLECTCPIISFESKKYFNLNLAYIELMYMISGYPLDLNLADIDYTEESMKEKYMKRRS